MYCVIESEYVEKKPLEHQRMHRMHGLQNWLLNPKEWTGFYTTLLSS